jgi:hypothetical protein
MSSLSVSSITTNPYQAASQGLGTGQSQLQQLGLALQSGNLAAAQQAFSALPQNAAQGGTSSTGGSTSNQSSLAALGQALQSGNLAAAQQAFSQVQQAGGHHHHHHGSHSMASSTQTTPASSTPLPTDANATPGTSGTDLTA